MKRRGRTRRATRRTAGQWQELVERFEREGQPEGDSARRTDWR